MTTLASPQAKRIYKMGRSRPWVSWLTRYGALVFASIVFLFPFIWIMLAGFKTPISFLMGEVIFRPVWLNFDELLFSKTSDYLLNFKNSIIVGLSSTILVIVFAILAAYSIQRLKWPVWVVHSLLVWSIIFHMLPPITIVGAWFLMFRAVNLDNTLFGLALAHLTVNLPMAIWLMSIFIGEVPKELEEAARIDGAGTPQIIYYVIGPLVLPGLAATCILVFIFSWNDFAVALNLTQRATQTVPIAIAKFAEENEIRQTMMAAAATLSVIPGLLLLLIGQRFIVRGLIAGSVK